jgi:hypothetical protein
MIYIQFSLKSLAGIDRNLKPGMKLCSYKYVYILTWWDKDGWEPMTIKDLVLTSGIGIHEIDDKTIVGI